MKSAVIVFPASNCDRDAAAALEEMTGQNAAMVWHQDSELPDVDLVVLPGGFSYGDYLRCGAMASQSAVMQRGEGPCRQGRRGAGDLQRLSGADRSRPAAGRADAQCGAEFRLQAGDPVGGRNPVRLHPQI